MYFLLVPKLQLGNREAEAPASRHWKLELPGLHSQAGAWEPAKFILISPLLNTVENTTDASNYLQSSHKKFC